MKFKFSLIVLMILMFAACGGEHPSFSKVVVKSNSSGVLLDTTDSNTLKTIHELFYNRKEAESADSDFKHFIDITDKNGTIRWQYSEEGFIRNHEVKSSQIYEIESVNAFNSILNIK